MRTPDFFIVGAPKCGTTSLYKYLGLHPGIFMPYPKEPNFYNIDIPGMRRIPDRGEYEALFARAPAGAVIGEASPFYLYSRKAVKAILSDNPAAKFIVCLRNPVDMYVSFHNQILFNLKIGENPDAEEAWRRSSSYPDTGEGDDTLPDQPKYAKICSLGAQVERLFATAGRDRVHVVLFEDISGGAASVYEAVLKFLTVESDGRSEFPVHNQRKDHRFPALSRFLMHPPFPFDRVKGVLRKALLAINAHPGNLFDDVGLLSKPAATPVLRPEFRSELVAYFAGDVSRLEQLIGRDLSGWRS